MPASFLSRAIKLYGVLVVDDSAVQRNHVTAMLEEIGVTRILEAVDGNSGLDILRDTVPPPAFLIVDLEMPGMDGIEMLQELATENARQPFLIVSGTDPNLLASIETMCHELKLPIIGICHKPLTAAALQQGLEGYSRITDTRIRQQTTQHIQIEPELLAAAISAGEITPHFQPKFNIMSGALEGFEALARWTSPQLGFIPPGTFVPLIEEHELIDPFTLSMLDAVLERMQHWQQEGFTPKVAINLSSLSLGQRSFCDDIIRHVQKSDIPPARIVLEITESSLISDLGQTLGAIGRLRLKGFGLSMDDYGTGFSTAQQLSRLPLTELKIDRSFVTGATTRPNLRTILASMISMGLDLGLTTLAEGVENEAELRLLQELGCQQVQGFLLGRPMPGDAVLPWWKSEQPRIQALVQG